ncbi:protein kinase putative [Entamoeba histolytica]|uniref:non-specific serine/threonine protein kinase n=4 Tax=Entamoeba TaxID=5758 RepID=C4LZF9_ENTH1|nr:myosin light chain kinase, putative [Entamoeba dispar SAW760]XP_653850.2 protein kinase, putative [Entamoeba histolytica HM-1:IMSS]EAL48464.2 protein kinase, putative [Entamoeba histolytica HM-1:IMSS]EDR24994.1 myosin light chain kinase, putative [Entamoeba dispar SAW760]GAT94248.1 protein kinase putative [Entamoeba histolytica]|eukprot:EDR24994.1 myosin light chain kinase, putative [Entamoeba dispar SAW760]
MSKEVGDYLLKKEIGKGAFSVVYEAIKKSTNEEVAVKVIDTAKSDPQKLQGEIKILKMVDHPYIIKLYDVFDGNDGKLYIITDLVKGGELFDRISDKTFYPEDKAKIVVKRLISAIGYLHSMNIVHRDLKPENILLKSPDDDTDVRIADFGFSKMITEDAQILLTACGTPVYVAPEVLNAKGYGMEVDMWSIGVITYVLLCGYPPFFGDTLGEILSAVCAADYDFQEEYWSEVSNEAIQFISNLLVLEPSLRLTAEEALQDPWLADVDIDNA